MSDPGRFPEELVVQRTEDGFASPMVRTLNRRDNQG